MTRLPGTWTRRGSAWLFGESPTRRFVDPAVADTQAQWVEGRRRGRWAALRIRLAGAGCVARALPQLVVRTEPSGAVAWGVGPVLAAGLGLLALAQLPDVLTRQLAWIVLGVLAALAVRVSAPWLGRPRPWLAWLVGTAAIAPVFVAGSAWIRMPLGNLVVAWPELARPAFLLALAALLGRRRSTVALLATIGMVAAWAAAGVAIAQPVHVLVTVGIALAALATGRARASRRALAACAALGAVCLILAIPPWGLAAMPRETHNLHTDFVLTLLAARGGLAVAGLAVAAVLGAAWMPLVAARATGDAEGRGPARTFAVALATGATLQVVAHLGGLVGLTPSPGAPLPLLSYGGSSAVGLLVSLGLAAALAGKGDGRREPWTSRSRGR